MTGIVQAKDEVSAISVLLVDDHPDFLDCAVDFLSRFDEIHIVGHATSALEAVQRAVQLAPDLILMDINLPAPGGLEATRRIKQLGNKSRVIMVTMRDSPDYEVQATQVGADGFISKFDFATRLLPLIHRLFPGLPDSSSGLNSPPKPTNS